MAQRPDAAVRVPVIGGRNGELRIVVIRRGNTGRHGGEIGLPGGLAEPGDADLAATSVRETVEELGVATDAVTLIERLPTVATRASGLMKQA
jgi:8-oxo-dGTP pyrophosphatase MutT (NUDIX family)